MKFSELPKWGQKQVKDDLRKNDCDEDKITDYINDKEDFRIVDYSADEDGSDLRIEY